jgi:DNA-binding beta-propeller fold protein YncE
LIHKIVMYLPFAIAVIVTSVLLPGIGVAGGGTAYRVLEQWPLPGAGGCRAMVVDSSAHLLYIVRNDRVTVINIQTGEVAGEVTGLFDARGIALDLNGKLGYISDGVGGNLHVFNRLTWKRESSIVIGGIPDSVVFEPSTHRIFVFNVHTDATSVFDASSNRIIGTISLPGKPATAVADGAGSIFVNIGSTSELMRIDAATLKAVATWTLMPCLDPSGLAIDSNTMQLFSVCENKQLVASDAKAGKVISSAAIGEGTKGVAFDPAQSLLFTSNGEGSLTVLQDRSPGTLTVLQTLKTQAGARMLAFDSANQRIYLVAAQFGQRPRPTSEELEFRPTMIPGTGTVLVVGR